MTRTSKKRLTLDDILESEDQFNLLGGVEAKLPPNAPHWITEFNALNLYLDNKAQGLHQEGDLTDRMMMRRKQGYIQSPETHEALRPYDVHNLLPPPAQEQTEPLSVSPPPTPKKALDPENITSLDDIFSSDAFGLLDQGDLSIFDMKHVSSTDKRESPDEIAQRRVCEDFYRFESLFIEAHQKIRSGELKTVRYQQASQMRKGDMFVLEGVLCLIDEVGEYREDSQGRYDPRLRVIFDNGTESNLLFQSLAKNLYTDKTGKRIISEASSVEDAFNNVSHRDNRSGQIYFVTTKSENPTLKAIPNLIKIGYTEQSVEQRTKNADRDTAFLEAPVKIKAKMECYNLDPHRFETLIHGFLHAQRLSMTLISKDGKRYRPQEWFSVPLDVAMEVVNRIVDGSIVHYRMDNTTNRLTMKGN